MESVRSYELIQQMNDYLIRVQHAVKPLCDAFYARPEEQHWNNLSDFLEGLEWLFSVSEALKGENNKTKQTTRLLDSLEQLRKHLDPLLDALENKDQVRLADIIQYEMQPIIDEMITTTNLQ